MNQQSQNNIKSPPPSTNDLSVKRKRGRPRRDENSTSKPDTNLVGKAVTGVVEGSFEAGYILNVKVKGSDTKLRGLVFIPGRVIPVTPETDLAPHATMYRREQIKNNQTDESVKDDASDLEITEAAQALALLPQMSNGEGVVHMKEATKEKDGVTEEQDVTRLVEFFPTTEAGKTEQTPNLVLVEKEKEQQKSHGESRGFDLMAAELQLELGNKTTVSGDNTNTNNNIIATTESDPKTSVSKSGFIANLFEGEEKNVDSNMEEEATPSVQ